MGLLSGYRHICRANFRGGYMILSLLFYKSASLGGPQLGFEYSRTLSGGLGPELEARSRVHA